MKICKSVPRHWDHSNRRVELHGAGSESDHGVSEGQVLAGEAVNVSSHVNL